jgi:hypothetical protein
VCVSAAPSGSSSGGIRAAVCNSALGRVCMAVGAAVCGCAALCGIVRHCAAVRAAVSGSVWQGVVVRTVMFEHGSVRQ